MYAPKSVNLPPIMPLSCLEILTESRGHLLPRTHPRSWVTIIPILPRGPFEQQRLGGHGDGGRAWRTGGLEGSEQAAECNGLRYRAEAVAHKAQWPWTPFLRNSPCKFE